MFYSFMGLWLTIERKTKAFSNVLEYYLCNMDSYFKE